jgi:hypothetical protein
MSGPLPLVVAAAASSPIGPPSLIASTPAIVAPSPLEHALSLAIPSTDGGRGALVMYERFLPARRLSLGVTGELRESADGDYTGLRVGAGAELRYYWREDAWLSRLPVGEMVGWFVGGGFDLATSSTHDDVDHRWINTTLQLGATARVGYRIAPWRHVIITPSTGFGFHRDFDTSGRLPGWTRGGLIVGLEAGWLF